MVVVVMEARGGQVSGKLAARQGRGGQAGVCAGLIQGQGVEGGEHAQVGQDGHIVFPVAVAVGGHVHHQGDMELGPPVHHGLGILRHAAVEDFHCVGGGEGNGVKVAGPQAPAAAHAVFQVHSHLPGGLVEDQTLVGALPLAALAAPAEFGIDLGISVVVLLAFAGPGTAAHADVLDGPAEAGHFVALEVGEADEYVRVHDGPADLGLLYVLAAPDRHQHVVGALQPVSDQEGAACREGGKAVLPCALQVLQRVLPAAGVHGIAVGEEGLASQRLYYVHHRPGVVGAEEADIAQLAEVHLDGDEFSIHVDLADAGLFQQLLQLGRQAVAIGRGMKIGKINLRNRHKRLLSFRKSSSVRLYGGTEHA